MAKTVEGFTFKKLGRPQEYPWDEWMNGETWVAEQGIDFQCELTSFRTYLYHKARLEQVSVQTSAKGNSLYFQFYTTNGKA